MIFQPIATGKVPTWFQKAWQLLANGLNGHISFGDGSKTGNLDGVWVSVTSNILVDTDFTVTHNLGRLPIGWLVFNQDKAASVYKGSVTWTSSQMTLKASSASVSLLLFVC